MFTVNSTLGGAGGGIEEGRIAMNAYAEQVNTAREYIAKAGINFSPFKLASLFSGLDFNRYEILKLIPQNSRSIVIIQKCKDPADPHYCLQYRGAGQYFSTWDELRRYYEGRFHDYKLRGVHF